MKKWLCCCMFALLCVLLPVKAQAAGDETVFITTANLNLRTEPTTESTKLLTVPRGTAIQVTDFMDYEWYAVTYDGMTGYMKAEFLTEETQLNSVETTDETTVATAEVPSGGVEIIEWAEAKKLFKIGLSVTVIDVRTKITYQVASFSNGKHADVEPVTADDTALMKRSYNGRWDWEPRPVLVLLDGRTLAASINGMPHGGGVNDNNNMNGQVCIHFKGSTTHNGNRSHERDHQNAVSEAYNTAVKW